MFVADHLPELDRRKEEEKEEEEAVEEVMRKSCMMLTMRHFHLNKVMKVESISGQWKQ